MGSPGALCTIALAVVTDRCTSRPRECYDTPPSGRRNASDPGYDRCGGNHACARRGNHLDRGPPGAASAEGPPGRWGEANSRRRGSPSPDTARGLHYDAPDTWRRPNESPRRPPMPDHPMWSTRDPRANASVGNEGPIGVRPNRPRWPTVDQHPLPTWEPAWEPPRTRRRALRLAAGRLHCLLRVGTHIRPTSPAVGSHPNHPQSEPRSECAPRGGTTGAATAA